MDELNDLMVAHGISVWVDPHWGNGIYGTPKWLAGIDMHAANGPYYSTLTGAGSATIEASSVGSGDTPLAAVRACIVRRWGKGRLLFD